MVAWDVVGGATILAALNLALARIVYASRPRSHGSVLVSLLLGANGSVEVAVAIAGLAGFPVTLGFVGGGQGWSPESLVALLNAATLALMLLVPLFVPYRRLKGWPMRIAVGLIVGLVAAFALVVDTPLGTFGGALLADAGALFPFFYFAGPILGSVLLLDAYFAARKGEERDRARVFLAAYLLAAGTRTTLAAPAAFAQSPSVAAALPVLALATMLAAPLALASRCFREREFDRVDLLIVLLPWSPILAATLDVPFEWEYLLARPVLLATGFIAFQLLDIDTRVLRVPLAVAILAAALGVDFFVADTLTRAGLAVAPAAALGLVVAALASAPIAWPLARTLADGRLEGRRLRVYRAALAVAVREQGHARARANLASLRRQLEISDREHEEVAHEVGSGELREGALMGGRYVFVRELGRGGSGVVVLAKDRIEGGEVAIKRLGEAARRDAQALARFRTETTMARAAASPHVVAVLDVFEEDGEVHLVMERMTGGTLLEKVRAEGPLPETEAIRMVREIASALDALHALGIVHRDVKPANVLFDAEGRAKLGDFTLARSAVSGDTLGITRVGAAVGSLEWMPPEQARGLAATPASDLYGAAATFYHALAGAPPVDVAGLIEYDARRRVYEDPPALPLATASLRTNEVLARCLAKRPEDRYPSAKALRDAWD